MTPEETPEPPPYVADDRLLQFEPDNLPAAQKGVSYEVEIKIENVKTFVGEITVSESELSPGLALERVAGENSAKIMGIPQQTGTFSFTLDVWCFGTNLPGQTGNKAYTIVVK